MTDVPADQSAAGRGGVPRPEPADLTGALRFLWWLIRCQRGRAALGAVLGTVWHVGLIVPPWLLSRAIDDGLRPGDDNALVGWVAALLVVGVLNAGIGLWRHRTMSEVRMDGAFRTVHAVVQQSTQLGAALTRRASAGEVATIGIADVWAISSSLTLVGPGVGAVVAYAVVAGLLLAISPLLALVVLLGAPLLGVLIGPALGRLLRVGTSYREQQGDLTHRMVDLVEGLSVLNGIGGKERYAERYREGSRALQVEGYRVGSVASWIPAFGVGLPMVFLAVVTWLGARMAAAGSMTIGELVAAYGYAAVLVVPVAELIWSSSMLSQSVVSARRVIALLRLETPTPSSPPARLPEQDRQQAPDGTGVLLDPASGVTVSPGRLTALVGSRPADSVAVLDRLGRMVPTAATWGGVRLDALPLAEVRHRILVADAESYLFAGPLREAVAGRGEASEAALSAALHTAAAEDVVSGLPDGLSSGLSAQGRNLSGGQRQRIRLARALLAEPETLLAADPTSAVDAHTETTIAERLRAARAGRTTVVTTTSAPLLGRADVVHYLAQGRVLASGTHAELLLTRPDYRALVSRGLDDR